MGSKLPVSIESFNYADVNICAQISCDAFAVDPHTIVKQLGRDGYDMFDIMSGLYLNNLGRPNFVYVKAVDSSTGEIVGYGGWMFSHVDDDQVPRTAPTDTKPVKEEKEEDSSKESTEPETKKEPDSIDRLHEREGEDMQYWLKKIIPANEPCMIIMSIGVAPAHQSRGVGSALIKHGNAIADRMGLPVWVHSSHQAVNAYSKCGFEPVRILDIDLDEYATRPPRDDEPVMGDKGSGKWGRYVIKYMKREPTKVK